MKENKIPSAEEFLLAYQRKYPRLQVETSTKEDMDNFYSSCQGAVVTIDLMIEFAKLHVKAALESAANKASTMEDPYAYTGNTGSEYPPDIIINKESILLAYSEELIK